jgi:electron transfer flavoprotein alpha/beta subunit
MRVAVCLESVGPGPASLRALGLAQALGESASVITVSCGAEPEGGRPGHALPSTATGRLVRVFDPALADAPAAVVGKVLAALTSRVGADLVLTGTASANEGTGLVPAALAHERQMLLLSGVDDLSLDSGRADAVQATIKLAGRCWRVRVPLPAVLAVLPGGYTLPEPTSPGPPESLSLAQLGLDPAALAVPGDLRGAFLPARRKPEVVANLDDLLLSTFGRGRPGSSALGS